jgi:hypothetical protein
MEHDQTGLHAMFWRKSLVGDSTARGTRHVYRLDFRQILSQGTSDRAAYHLVSSSCQMWGNMNDDQRMWIIGSFIYFAAGEGFRELRGYDLSESKEESQSFMSSESCNTSIPVQPHLRTWQAPLNLESCGRYLG